jgi:hypothetical protein
MMILPRSILVAAVAFAIFGWNPARAADVVYQERFGSSEKPEKMMSGSLLLGRSGAWSGAVAGERYVLENRQSAKAVHYNFVNVGAKYDLGRVNVALTVEAEGQSERYGAGILFDYDRAAPSYWAFTVRDGHYLVLRRGPGGMRRVAAGTVDGLELSQPTQLVLINKDGKLNFFVGRRPVVSVHYTPESGAGTGRGVGLIAFGLGSFRFDDFIVAVN